MNVSATNPSAQAILVALACQHPRCPCHLAVARGRGDTHCPCHDDRHPSLGVKEEGGRVLVCCGAGCAQEIVIAALRDRGVWPEVAAGLTLDALAQAKRLPNTFLESLGVHEVTVHGKPRVEIDYLDEQGQIQAVRYRIGLDPSGPRFLWRRGDHPMLYGLQRLREFAQRGWVMLGEGESDTWTAWRYDLPFLGIPGKDAWQDAWAAPFRQRKIDVYLWIEPDAQDLLDKVVESLPDVCVVFAPPGIKDLSDAHLQGQDVRALVQRLVESAPTAGEAMRQVEERKREAVAAETLKVCGDLLGDPRLLDRIGDAIQTSGLAGDLTNAKVVELGLVSRMTDRPVNFVVTGPSAAGKNWLLNRVAALHPAEAIYDLNASSERALAFTEADLRHRVVVIGEAAGLHRDGIGATLMRSIVWDGRLVYETVEKTADGLRAKRIEKDGPIGLITTATRDLDGELATRLLTITVPDDPAQTRAVVRETGRREAGAKAQVDLDPFVAAHAWLAAAGAREAVVPYGPTLAEMVDVSTVRVRRDFTQMLALVKACALLYQRQRPRDRKGRVVATLDDYRIVHSLTAELFGVVSSGGLTADQREAVEAVRELHEATGAAVSYQQVADRLGIDRSSASRRLRKPLDAGFIVNDEERPRRPARLRPGETPPGPRPALPHPEELLQAIGDGDVPPGTECTPARTWGEPLEIKAPVRAVGVCTGDERTVHVPPAEGGVQQGTARSQPLENKDSQGVRAGVQSIPGGSDTHPLGDGQTPESIPEVRTDPIVAEAVRRWGPPVEIRRADGSRRVVDERGGRRIYLQALAQSWDWPRIYIGAGETILSGQEAWAKFLAKAEDDRIAWAIADLESLETGRPS